MPWVKQPPAWCSCANKQDACGVLKQHEFGFVRILTIKRFHVCLSCPCGTVPEKAEFWLVSCAAQFFEFAAILEWASTHHPHRQAKGMACATRLRTLAIGYNFTPYFMFGCPVMSIQWTFLVCCLSIVAE